MGNQLFLSGMQQQTNIPDLERALLSKNNANLKESFLGALSEFGVKQRLGLRLAISHPCWRMTATLMSVLVRHSDLSPEATKFAESSGNITPTEPFLAIIKTAFAFQQQVIKLRQGGLYGRLCWRIDCAVPRHANSNLYTADANP